MLRLIGVGYPRTGTMSLKFALEQLGYGPCYHMIEVFDRPNDVAFWQTALAVNGDGSDWNEVFESYSSTADCPACHFWRSLQPYYPTAKYILTIRDSESWYKSCQATIYEAMTHPERSPDETHKRVQVMAKQLILDEMFEGQFEDRDFAIRKYEEHNREIRATIPAADLLVLDIADGWAPLCRFLNVEVPNTPFPKANTRVEFQERFAVASE